MDVTIDFSQIFVVIVTAALTAVVNNYLQNKKFGNLFREEVPRVQSTNSKFSKSRKIESRDY
mgnify:CR=1 FL=1